MRLQDHIGMLSWSLLDKALFIIYGFIFILVINYSNPSEYGLYSILIAIHTWIFTISDSFALQSIIQFGMNLENRKKVNLIGLLIHLIITFGTASIFFIFKYLLAGFFNAPIIIEIATYLPILTLAYIPRAYCQKLIYREQKMFLLFISNSIFFGINAIYILIIIMQKGILDFYSLIIGYIIGSLFSSIISIILTRKQLQFSFTGKIKLSEILHFNWKMTIVSLLYSLPRQMDTVFLKIFFSLEAIGIYSAAKTIFRVFDEAMNAVTALVYPSAVKYINGENRKDLETLISKTFSFGFIVFLSLFLLLLFGGSNFIFNLPIIPSKYHHILNYFNILILSLPFLQFNITYSVMVAQHKMFTILYIISVSVLLSYGILWYIGSNFLISYLPFGLAFYYIITGLIGLIYASRFYNFKIKSLFGIFYDLKNYLIKSN